MRRVIGHRIGLADALAIDEVGRHQIGRIDGARVAHRERRILQRPADRAPQIDHLDPALEQFLGLVGQQVADPLRAGARGVVDMDTGRRLARPARRPVLSPRHAAALQMVEDEDAAGAGVFGDESARPPGNRPGAPRHRPRNP